MLKIAKEALAGALESSGGSPSGISENLIMELSLVNPLSEVCADLRAWLACSIRLWPEVLSKQSCAVAAGARRPHGARIRLPE